MQFIVEYWLLCAGMFLIVVGCLIAVIKYSDIKFQEFVANSHEPWERYKEEEKEPEIETEILPVVVCSPIRRKAALRKVKIEYFEERKEDYPVWIL